MRRHLVPSLDLVRPRYVFGHPVSPRLLLEHILPLSYLVDQRVSSLDGV